MLIKNPIEVQRFLLISEAAGAASINQSGRCYTCGQMYKLLNKLLYKKATACHGWLNIKRPSAPKGLFIWRGEDNL